MIIINYYFTLIDKDYHCQDETHTFSIKIKKHYEKRFPFRSALFTNIIHIYFPLTDYASLSHAERKRTINLKI